MSHIDSRLNDLEVKLSFTEDLVDELNRTIFRQQQQIDLLVREIRALRGQVSNMQPEERHSLREEIPPHY